ncbi:GNAT family N-acetyltransferase [Candidatus Gracilibacteria bacterium]|nr:GNAT family N-acetyltransferase [Candidatus Gracilibacteria bacterium]
MNESNNKVPKSKSFNVGEESFTLEVVDFVDDDVAEFFNEHWKEHITSSDRAIHKSVFGMLNSLEEIKVIRNSDGEIVAMSLIDQGDKEDHTLGSIIVDPSYKRKGLATIIAEDQIGTILHEVPDKKSIGTTAESTEGLKFALNFADEIKDRVKLEIDYSKEALTEIMYDIIEKFSFQVEDPSWNTLFDLYDEEQLTVEIPDNLKEELLEHFNAEDIEEEISIDDQMYFLLLKNGLENNIALWKMDNPEELRVKLQELGIIIKTPTKYLDM